MVAENNCFKCSSYEHIICPSLSNILNLSHLLVLEINVLECFFFAVIDILRMIVLHPDGAAKLVKCINDGNGNPYFKLCLPFCHLGCSLSLGNGSITKNKTEGFSFFYEKLGDGTWITCLSTYKYA